VSLNEAVFAEYKWLYWSVLLADHHSYARATLNLVILHYLCSQYPSM